METHILTIKWAASKLMDDIRVNNDISWRTLHELLDPRFRVTLKTSTLYKMRTLALKEITGDMMRVMVTYLHSSESRLCSMILRSYDPKMGDRSGS